MSYYRNYTPVYKETLDERINDVKQKIKDNYKKFYIETNPQPYNCHGLDQNIEIEHYTLRYDKRISKGLLRSKCEVHRILGFDVREVSDKNRSVPLPHIHFLKKKNTT